MSNQGIRGFYQVTNTLKEQLLKDQNINTVTTGDISDVNLRKQDMFPMAHIIINSVVVGEQTLSFNISVLAMDIVNESKDKLTKMTVAQIKQVLKEKGLPLNGKKNELIERLLNAGDE